MIPKSVQPFSEKIMLKQEAEAGWRFEEKSSRFRAEQLLKIYCKILRFRVKNPTPRPRPCAWLDQYPLDQVRAYSRRMCSPLSRGLIGSSNQRSSNSFTCPCH